MCSRPSFGAALVAAMSCVHLNPAAGQTPTNANPLIVSLGEAVVHESDLDEWWQAHDSGAFFKVRQQLYEGRRKALDGLLAEYLLGREAARRGIAVQDLLDEELPKHAPAVTDAELRSMYERSLPLPAGVTFEQLKPMVFAYLEQQHLEEARTRFAEELRAAAGVVPHLEPPRQILERSGSDPAKGNRSAPVRIVEFSDFECPFCRQLEPVLKQLLMKYGDRIQLLWKDFPLTIHEHAHNAAEAARCAGDQGRFWEYHDILFSNQQALGDDDLQRHASDAGLDVGRFLDCFKSGVHRREVVANLDEGTRQGVGATPTIFINGRAIVGVQAIDAYENVILDELRR